MSWWSISVLLFAGVTGYAAGYQHGSDRLNLAIARATAPIEVPVASPLADTCSVMLEAAWAIEDAPLRPTE